MKTHGLTGTPEHRVWIDMRTRCRNPNCASYPNYGGRGITICERWDDFALFLEDMGERPGPGYSIERRDNDSHYGPDNCYWATRLEQSRNRRKPQFRKPRGKSPFGFRTPNTPNYYIQGKPGRYRLCITLRQGHMYRRRFTDLDKALVARADCEMEREMYRLLGGT